MTRVGKAEGHGGQPITPLVTGLFFALATVLTAGAGVSLLTPNGPLDLMWRIKPREHGMLLRVGPLAGFGFCGLSLVVASGSFGCLARRRWGWGLALAIFVVNGLCDAVRVPFGAPWEGGLGVMVAGLIVWWLSRPNVRNLFG